jgi:predicted transcriptional regulator of viral defense system
VKINIDGTEYPFSADALTFDEACDLEEVFGGTFGEFGTALKKTSMQAIRAFVYILRRRDNPTLRIGDIGGKHLSELKFVKERADEETTEDKELPREVADPTQTDSEQPETKSEG